MQIVWRQFECQILFSGKNIINLLSVEIAQRVVIKVITHGFKDRLDCILHLVIFVIKYIEIGEHGSHWKLNILSEAKKGILYLLLILYNLL